jgi:hypothetical protein
VISALSPRLSHVRRWAVSGYGRDRATPNSAISSKLSAEVVIGRAEIVHGEHDLFRLAVGRDGYRIAQRGFN